MNSEKFTPNQLKEHIHERDTTWIQHVGTSYHPLRTAEALSELPVIEIWTFLSLNDATVAAAIFSEFDEEGKNRLIQQLKLKDFVWILSAMSHDERADLVAKLPEEVQRQVMTAMAFDEQEDIRKLAAYPEGSAGAIMTSDFTTIGSELLIEEAIKSIRHQAEDCETIYYIYVTDTRKHLVGMCTLKDLILAKPRAKIEEIMHTDLIYGYANDDQEEIARKIAKYNFLAIPILDPSDALVGIVTHDDALDVIQQEQTEDLEKFMAITGSHKGEGYLKTSSWTHMRNRSSWLVVLAFLGLVSGWILHSYEATLSHAIILALYLPMIADSGGNAGSQSATVVIRALTLGEITASDLFRVFFKELRISLGLALLLGVLALGKVYFLSRGIALPFDMAIGDVAGVIAIALGLQVVISTLLGAVLPIIVSEMKLDPAVVASPAITTLVDITGMLIYFFTATRLLGI